MYVDSGLFGDYSQPERHIRAFMAGKEYRFNPDTLTYERIREPVRLRIYRYLRHGIVLFLLVCILNMLFSLAFRTPKMERIARENDELLVRYDILSRRISEAEARLDAIHQRDIKVYRPLFGADTMYIPGIYIPYSDSVYADLNGYEYSGIMVSNWKSLDRLGRKIYLQSRSLDQLQMLATDKETMATAVPAIWPIDKRNLRNNIGAYGNRFHPIYPI